MRRIPSDNHTPRQALAHLDRSREELAPPPCGVRLIIAVVFADACCVDTTFVRSATVCTCGCADQKLTPHDVWLRQRMRGLPNNWRING